VRHEARDPGRPARIEQPPDERRDLEAQALLGVRRLLGWSAGFLGRGALLGVVEDGGVEALLVAEVIVDGGDVGGRAPADLGDGGTAVPGGREHLGCGIEQTLARPG
jgi:hypothetical protein